jgi:hypothetical protein
MILEVLLILELARASIPFAGLGLNLQKAGEALLYATGTGDVLQEWRNQTSQDLRRRM